MMWLPGRMPNESAAQDAKGAAYDGERSPRRGRLRRGLTKRTLRVNSRRQRVKRKKF